MSRNDSAHKNIAPKQEMLTVLKFTYRIAVWLMQVYGDGSFRKEPFVVPEPTKRKTNLMPLVKIRREKSRSRR